MDPLVNAICTPNPAALTQAAQLDTERDEGRVRGPLHGVPVLVKDNIDTADLPTTAGSLALADQPPPPARRPTGTTAARGGLRRPGQDQPERVGQLPRLGVARPAGARTAA